MRGGSNSSSNRSQGLTVSSGSSGSSFQSTGFSHGRLAAVRSRLRDRGVSERKQVGDAESMINEEPNVVQPGGASEWLE